MQMGIGRKLIRTVPPPSRGAMVFPRTHPPGAVNL